jgi:hypothetical protein
LGKLTKREDLTERLLAAQPNGSPSSGGVAGRVVHAKVDLIVLIVHKVRAIGCRLRDIVYESIGGISTSEERELVEEVGGVEGRNECV